MKNCFTIIVWLILSPVFESPDNLLLTSSSFRWVNKKTLPLSWVTQPRCTEEEPNLWLTKRWSNSHTASCCRPFSLFPKEGRRGEGRERQRIKEEVWDICVWVSKEDWETHSVRGRKFRNRGRGKLFMWDRGGRTWSGIWGICMSLRFRLIPSQVYIFIYIYQSGRLSMI